MPQLTHPTKHKPKAQQCVRVDISVFVVVVVKEKHCGQVIVTGSGPSIGIVRTTTVATKKEEEEEDGVSNGRVCGNFFDIYMAVV